MRLLMPENSKKMTNLRQVSRPQVVVLAYDGLCTFEFGVAVEILACHVLSWATPGIALLWQVWIAENCGRRAGSAW